MFIAVPKGHVMETEETQQLYKWGSQHTPSLIKGIYSVKLGGGSGEVKWLSKILN